MSARLAARLSLWAALLLAGAPRAAGQVACTASADPVVFGSYSPLDGTGIDATGRVRVRCDRPTEAADPGAYVIRLGPGASGDVVRRALLGPEGGTLAYRLYTDATRTTIWGDGTGGSSTVADAFSLSIPFVSREYVVYAHLPARQNVRPGAYADAVIVTVEF